jgi:hypothetical protein
MKKLIYLTLLIFLVGCVTTKWEMTVNDYNEKAGLVDLGMTTAKVTEILKPTQYRLKNTEIKQPDRYLKDGVKVEIIYFRSGWQSDGLTTDDEFTPYIFNDGKLVAIGWATLGGPKSQGQATSDTYIHQSTTTVVY